VSWSDAAFDDFLARVRGGARERERERRLLHDEVAELRALGFGALRLPAAQGGADLPFEGLVARLIRLSAADASLEHLWRGHVAFVEDLRGSSGVPERWAERLRAGDLVGNAQSERQETAVLTTRLDREDGVVLLSGTKYYTTGSIYADWVHLAALDGDERVAVTVRAAHEGVRSVDDWDGFGQLLTGSGTTTFDQVPVRDDDIGRADARTTGWHLLGAVLQLALLAVIAGIAQRALEDAVEYVTPRRRTFGFAGETLPREDPLAQLVVGEVSAAASAARRLVLSCAADLGRCLDAGDDAADVVEQRELLLEVFRLQHVVPELVLAACTRLFEVGGASAVSTAAGLDRHWRNVRTVASHNPTVQRTRAVGMVELTGELPAWKAPGA